MARKMKVAVGAAFDAFEISCGWACAVVAAYALMFVNVSGNGALWDAARSVALDAASASVPKNTAFRMRTVPARPTAPAEKVEDRMLVVPEAVVREFKVPVLAEEQPRAAERPAEAERSPVVRTGWRRSLTGSLRAFAVYGRGEESSSASVSSADSGKVQAAADVRPIAAATPATEASPYRAGFAVQPRPGIGDRVARVGGTADGVRNFR